jgi:CRP-like cAMP-binding protein
VSIPDLSSLPEEAAGQMIRAARRRSFRSGEVLFHEGDPADSLHLITRGKVAALVTSPGGQQLTLSIMREGEMLGELALLTSAGQRSATVRALEATETLSIHRDDFGRLLREQPAISVFFLRLLAERVLNVTTRLREALYVPVEWRVRRRLVELARIYGGEGAEAVIPLSQESVAGLAGTARATVNRVLQEEVRHGTVRLHRRRIVVVDPTAIAMRAGQG